jgi:hypothetical protein
MVSLVRIGMTTVGAQWPSTRAKMVAPGGDELKYSNLCFEHE